MDLDAPPLPVPVRRRRTVPALAIFPLILLAVIGVGAGAYAMNRADPRLYRVQVGVSAYPADATAQWRDAAGASHTLDPWSGAVVAVTATSVEVAVSGDGIQCAIIVDGRTVDSQTATEGHPALCGWTA